MSKLVSRSVGKPVRKPVDQTGQLVGKLAGLKFSHLDRDSISRIVSKSLR